VTHKSALATAAVLFAFTSWIGATPEQTPEAAAEKLRAAAEKRRRRAEKLAQRVNGEVHP